MPYDERDTETQRFTPTYSDEDFLDAVRELEIAGTGEVKELVSCTRRNARKRLNELAERGELERREIGDRYVYLHPE